MKADPHIACSPRVLTGFKSLMLILAGIKGAKIERVFAGSDQEFNDTPVGQCILMYKMLSAGRK